MRVYYYLIVKLFSGLILNDNFQEQTAIFKNKSKNCLRKTTISINDNYKKKSIALKKLIINKIIRLRYI